jgi:hypothetical protein
VKVGSAVAAKEAAERLRLYQSGQPFVEKDD